MAPDPFKHSSRVPFFEIITTRFPGGIAAEGTVISGDRHVKAVRPHFAEGPNRCDAPVKGPLPEKSAVWSSIVRFGCLNGFGVDIDLDFVTHDQAARLERLIVGHPVIFAAQFPLDFEADPVVAPGIFDRAA